MRTTLFFLLLCSFHFAQAQFIPKYQSGDSAFVLVADNGRHYRLYTNQRTLKIHYTQGGNLVKAKGRLYIASIREIQLIPFGKKDIVTITLDSIVSTTPWHRKGKIGAAIVAATGLAAFGGAALLASPRSPGVVDGSLASITLVLYAVAAAYYDFIVLSGAFLGEWLFIRSLKKGYHFSIDKVAIKRDLWGKTFPRDSPGHK